MNPSAVWPEPTAAADEQALVEALRGGDEAAFEALLERHHGTMIAVALNYVRDRAVAEAVATLPESPRLIITLRDVQGWSAEEVCESLAISAGNQRVLLHRARSRVRNALEQHLG